MNPKMLPVGICAHLSPAMMSRHALSTGYQLALVPIMLEAAREMAPLILSQFSAPAAASCVGYRNSADVVGHALNISLPQNRALVSLEIGDTVLLAHLSGRRLPEMATSLPEGTHLSFYLGHLLELS